VLHSHVVGGCIGTDADLQISLDDPGARLEADLSVAILSPKELRVKMTAKA
jgi:hypothetical protein